jgi:hypothetical protein
MQTKNMHDVDLDKYIGNARAWRDTFGSNFLIWRSAFCLKPETWRMSPLADSV